MEVLPTAPLLYNHLQLQKTTTEPILNFHTQENLDLGVRAIMSVSALIGQFSNMSSSSTESPPQSPDITTRGSVSRRHYSTSSVGSSRSESPASCGSHSPRLSGAQNRHSSVGNDSKPRTRLSSITEDRIRMFNRQCQSDKESTDGGVQSSRRAAMRQMSAGSNEPGKESMPKVRATRQLSAGAVSGRSPSPFRLPGMATAAGGEYQGRHTG